MVYLTVRLINFLYQFFHSLWVAAEVVDHGTESDRCSPRAGKDIGRGMNDDISSAHFQRVVSGNVGPLGEHVVAEILYLVDVQFLVAFE